MIPTVSPPGGPFSIAEILLAGEVLRQWVYRYELCRQPTPYERAANSMGIGSRAR